MACLAEAIRAPAAVCASAPSVSGSVTRNARVSLASPFFNQGVKSLSVSQIPKTRVRNGASLVVDMAKREEELVEVRKMSDEDINLTVVDLKGELFLLRTKQATRQEFRSSEFRRIRKNVSGWLVGCPLFSLILLILGLRNFGKWSNGHGEVEVYCVNEFSIVILKIIRG